MLPPTTTFALELCETAIKELGGDGVSLPRHTLERRALARDGSGAVILSGDVTTPEQTLAWIPAANLPAVELVRGELMCVPHWGH